MKPNGRRRWRKWLARQRQRGVGPAACWGLCGGRVGAARKAQGRSWAGADLPALRGLPFPVKPFAVRKLPGMTQGARKRAADRVAVAALGNDRAHAYTREYGSYLRSGEYLGAYWTARAKYRIGEKLRPCVGCLRCQCQTAFDAWPALGEALAKDLPTCDGSGVLPARRS